MTNTPPKSMTAIAIEKPGDADVLKPATIPTPIPKHGEVLIKVAAAGVNRGDIVQRQGFYPPPPGAPETPGLEVAGEIAALGPGVLDHEIGDRVCALIAGGGYAEYCVVDAPLAMPTPKPLSDIEAAAVPEACFTVWTNIFDRTHLIAGETLLIHGGSSGIGTMAIQMANLTGARVFTTAGSLEKCTACEELGAEKAINYREEDFVDVCKSLTDGRGVDVILDMVGGDYIARNISALALEGRMVNIAYLQGSVAEINFMPIMLKRLTVTGSTLRAQSLASKSAIASALAEKIWPLLDQGRIKPIIDSTFPLEKAGDAHRRMESSKHIGKIILTNI